MRVARSVLLAAFFISIFSWPTFVSASQHRVLSVDMPKDLHGHVPIGVHTTHTDEDVQLTVDVSLDGGVYRSARISEARLRALSPEGGHHQLMWDMVNDLGFHATNATLRITAPDSAPYEVNLAGMEVTTLSLMYNEQCHKAQTCLRN